MSKESKMELISKLPKPSGLKRPGVIFNTVVVPSSRIKLSSKTFTSSEPFSEVTNHLSLKGKRAASPDIRERQTGMRGISAAPRTLRRSRSACEIAILKKTGSVLPPKLPQVNEKPATSTRPPPPRTVGTNKNGLASRGNFKANIVKKPEPVKKGGVATSTSTTGATKPINKRIPPYDFKARYHDLLEKHKALKEKHQQATDQLENFENLPEQIEHCKNRLELTKNQLMSTTEDNEKLKTQNVSLNSQLDSISSNYAKCMHELEAMKVDYNALKIQYDELCEESKLLKDKNEKLTLENEFLTRELKICQEKLFASNYERKVLHNEIMDMRGNIRVFCRVRPPLTSEEGKALCGWNYIDETTVEITNYDLINNHKPGTHTFNFDHVFHPRSRQEDVFELVSPLIQSAMDGYNICIFAYGQTGSGKTFTMDGIDTNIGVIPRTVDLIFQSIESYKHLGWIYTIKVTFLEIYNEVLYDLLSNEQKEMEIRMVRNNKTDIYVSNITEEEVHTAEDLRKLMAIAKMNRATAATAGNERSSRSHAVTKIELNGYHDGKNEYSIGTINLVDLAGSESPKTSIRMTETKNINRSLSELTNVILALLQKKDHIPYRNSKLTHLLMPSLGGNSKTLMFINVAPFTDCYAESIKSLRFAASVNSCKMAKAKRNRIFNTSSSSGSI